MKRRVRVQPSNPYYSDEPAVAKSLIADKGMTQNASLGNQPPKTVDKHPAKLSGLAGFTSKHKLPSKGLGGSPAPTQPTVQGKLRVSGHPGAHRLGGVKLKV